MDVTTVLQQLHQCGDSWDAVQDELLLRALQSLRDGILRQAEDTEKQLLASSQRAEAVGLKLRAANCHLEVLAQSQFLEHRIQTEEDEVDPTCLTEDLWSSCQVEPVPEVELDAIKKALSLGQNFVENQVIDEMPPLPPVIGSEAWQNSFITNVEDFLGETETPAVAAGPASPATEEVEEEAVDPDETVDWGEAEATPSFAPTSLAPEPPNLASQLNALLTRRGGPVEGDGQGNAEEGQASDPLGLAPLGGAPKAKGKGKGKSKSTAKPTGSLFDEGPTEVKKPQAAASSPGASLFDEPPIQAAASPAKTGSSLFDDDAPAPLAQASPAKMGSLFDDEPLPKAAKAPTAKTAPATKGKGKSAPSLFDEGPQAKAAPKAAPKPTIAASLFDDEPPAQKPPAKAQASASSLFGEDPLFNDAPAKPGPKRDSGPLKVGGGGSIFDDDATRTAPSGEGLGLLATLAPRPPRQEPLGPEASPSGEPKVEAQEPSKPAGLFGDEVRPNPLFGTAASTAASSPNRKSRLDSLDADVPVPAAAPAAKASGPSLFGGSGRLARNIFDDDDDVVKQDGSSKVSSLFGAAMPTVPPAKAPAERDAPTGVPKATAAEPSKPAGGLFGDNEVRSNPLFGTAASAPSTRKPRLDSNEEDAPASAPAAAPAAPTPAAAAAAVPFVPPTVAAKASSGGRPKDIFDDDDVAKQAAPSVSSSLFGAAPKASAEPEEGKVLSAASAAEPSKPAGGLFEDNEVRSNPLFGIAASAPSTRKPRLDSNEEDAPASAPAAAPAAPAAAAAVPFAPPTVAAKASSGPSLFGGSGRLAKDIFDDDDDDEVVKQAPVGSSGLFGAPVPPAPAAVAPLQAAEPPASAASPAPAGSGAGGAACASKEASKAAGLFGDSEVRFNPLSGSAPSSMLCKSSLDSLDGDAPAPAAAAPAAAPAVAAAPAAPTLPFAPPLVATKASSGGPSLFGGSGRLATNIFDDDDDDGFVKQAAPSGSAVSSLFAAAAPVAQAAPPDPLVAGDDARKTSGEGQAVASAAPAAEPPKPAGGGLFGDSEVRFNPLSGSAPASSTLRKSSLDSVDGDVPAPPAAPPAASTVPFAPPLVAAKASSGGPSLFGGSGRMATSIFDDDDDDDFVKQAAPTGSTLSSLFGAPAQAAPADPLGALAGPKTEPEPPAEKSSDPLGGKVVFKPPL